MIEPILCITCLLRFTAKDMFIEMSRKKREIIIGLIMNVEKLEMTFFFEANIFSKQILQKKID